MAGALATADDLEDFGSNVNERDDGHVADVGTDGDLGQVKDGPGAKIRRWWWASTRSRWGLIVAGLLFAASVSTGAVQYMTQHRADEETSERVARAALAEASAGAVAVVSYAPETLDRDLVAAKSHLTGEFLTYYGKFVDQVVAPAVRQKAVKSTASVGRAAITELHRDTAKVLVFLNQTTVSQDRPEPVQTASSVVVSLAKVNDNWLISAVDPL